MRRFLVVSMVCLMAVAIAAPSFALEVKWGGLFRARVMSEVGIEGSSGDFGYGSPFTASGKLNADYTWPSVDLSQSSVLSITKDASGNITKVAEGAVGKAIPYTRHLNRFDQRLRMFIDFVSSENLKVVTKYETNAVWGATASSSAISNPTGTGGSGNVGADSGSLNIKNAYIDFNIPQTVLNFKVGVQTVTLLDSWIVDADVSAALMTASLKPVTVVLGYVGGQNFNNLDETENIDDLAGAVVFSQGPFTAAVFGLWQDAHNTPASIFPTIKAANDDPLQVSIPGSTAIPSPYSFLYKDSDVISINKASATAGVPIGVYAKNNQLFDLGLKLAFKVDFLSAYLNFVKNFGSFKAGVAQVGKEGTGEDMLSGDYNGWMIDAGVSYFCGPFTANIGGFYTSGPSLKFVSKDLTNPVSAANPQVIANSLDVETFTYPLTTTKYFSEIMGHGILDNISPNGGYWRGAPNPTNLWTITLGGAYEVVPGTKLSLSYWYFGTAEKVPSRFNPLTGYWGTSSDLGHEIDLGVTQKIVDNLNLDLVAAYMFTGDAYRTKTEGVSYPHDDNVYELGARLQWTW